MTLRTSHGDIALPAFLPDATRGAIRGVESADVAAAGVQGLVVNAYHLMLRPGARLIEGQGGIHRFMGWDRPILTDSGGFQVFSLIRGRPSMGTIRRDEVIFHSPYDGDRTVLSPAKCIQIQFHLGADIMMCLDDCTHADERPGEQADAVERTIRWARQCRETFDAIVSRKSGGKSGDSIAPLESPSDRMSAMPSPDSRHDPAIRNPQSASSRPLLFGIIQGGTDLDLRRRCADALIDLDFDGYALGGWPLDRQGALLEDVLARVAGLMPADKPRYAMGIGKPENVVACARMGYDLFDCVIPTRDARHHHVFGFTAGTVAEIDLTSPGFYEKLNLLNGRFARDGAPISSICDCACCRRYSRAYLRHLFRVGDLLGAHLATIHNLRFYTMLMDRLRGGTSVAS